MKTKEKILEKAKELFNNEGIQKTTLRQIAAALGMSQGNLNYHFKTKKDIIDALYFDLVKKMNSEIGSMTKNFSFLSSLYYTSEKTMHVFYEYRFFLCDMYLIFRESEDISAHYLKLQEVRKSQFQELFNAMIEKEVLRPEEFTEEYSRLYERMTILGDNWINAAELFKMNEGNPIKYYHDLGFEMIYPYLTKKGKEQYHDISTIDNTGS